MNIQTLFGYLLVSFLCLSTCQEEALDDVIVPEIQIESPGEGGTFDSGQMVSIKAIITEDQELQAYSLTVYRVDASSRWYAEYQEEKPTEGQRVIVIAEFTPDVQLDPTTYLIQIMAEDHGGNFSLAESTFDVLP